MTNQDFTRRMVVVVRKDIEPWQMTNAISHIAAYLGNKMNQPFDTGTHFIAKDKTTYPRNSQYPIITKVAETSDQLHNLFKSVSSTDLLHIAFIRQMIDHTDDTALQEEVSSKDSHELEYLGVGVFGNNEDVKALTKNFSLFS